MYPGRHIPHPTEIDLYKRVMASYYGEQWRGNRMKLMHLAQQAPATVGKGPAGPVKGSAGASVPAGRATTVLLCSPPPVTEAVMPYPDAVSDG